MELQPANLDILLSEELRAIEIGKKTPKEALSSLSDTGLFLFHGSKECDLTSLEPRQAKNFGAAEGDPSVYATDLPDIAIFRSIQSGNARGGWKNDKNGKLFFYLSEEDYDENIEAKEMSGFVYVLNRAGFRNDPRLGWVSAESAAPLSCIPVTIKDLPELHLMGDEKLKKFGYKESVRRENAGR